MNLERDAYREKMFLKGMMLLMTAWFLGAFFWVALLRIGYPYELALPEGTNFLSVIRIIHHQPLYTEPSLNWIPPQNAPFYYYLSSACALIFGESITILRLISLCASIATGVLFYRFLRNTGVDDIFAMSGLGLYFAAYAALGVWYDLAAPDSLAVFLIFTSLTLVVSGSNWFRIVLSALLACLAIFTKLQFVIIWAMIFILWWRTDKNKLKIFAITSFISLTTFSLILYLSSEGHAWFNMFLAPFKHQVIFTRLFSFWSRDLLGNFPLIFILSIGVVFGLCKTFGKKAPKLSDNVFFIFIIGFTAVSFIDRLFAHSLDNALIPALLALAGLTAWALQHFHNYDYDFGWLIPVLIKSLVVLQFLLLIYQPNKYIPTEADKEAGKNLMDKISSFQGEVLIPSHNYYTYLAAKKPYADWQLADYIQSGKIRTFALPADIHLALENHHFQAIILDQPENEYHSLIGKYYQQSDTLFQESHVFWQKSGTMSRPQYLYLPK